MSKVLDAVRQLAPSVSARADEITTARRVPAELLAELIDAGCFRALVPRSHGGAELDLVTHLHMVEELARADGSVGWTVMIGATAPLLLALQPRSSFDSMYAASPDIILAGTFNPTGVARPERDGFRVTGQWSFASGCQHAHWFIAHCMLDDGGDGPPRMMVLPPDDVDVKDTWSVSGLCGTGSHDFVVNDVFVPAERTFELGGPPCVDAPLHRIPELSFSVLNFAAVAVGIAHGALEEIVALALDKVPAFDDRTLAANPLFQHQLAVAETRLRAARSLLDADAATAWETAVASMPFTAEHRARVRGTTTWVTQIAVAVVDMAYTAGGVLRTP